MTTEPTPVMCELVDIPDEVLEQYERVALNGNVDGILIQDNHFAALLVAYRERQIHTHYCDSALETVAGSSENCRYCNPLDTRPTPPHDAVDVEALASRIEDTCLRWDGRSMAFAPALLRDMLTAALARPVSPPVVVDEPSDDFVDATNTVNEVASMTGNSWHDEWLDFYKPEEWFSARRAAASFIAARYRPHPAAVSRAVDVLAKAEQAELEIRSNLERDPNWYTRGSVGKLLHMQRFLTELRDAHKAIRNALQPEAGVGGLEEENRRLRGTLEYLMVQAKNGTLANHVTVQNCKMALGGGLPK
jgi:hypothetical protein